MRRKVEKHSTSQIVLLLYKYTIFIANYVNMFLKVQVTLIFEDRGADTISGENTKY